MRLLYLLSFVVLGLQRIKREYPMLQGGIIEVGGQRPWQASRGDAFQVSPHGVLTDRTDLGDLTFVQFGFKMES
jgi:hypothetical protein